MNLQIVVAICLYPRDAAAARLDLQGKATWRCPP